MQKRILVAKNDFINLKRPISTVGIGGVFLSFFIAKPTPGAINLFNPRVIQSCHSSAYQCGQIGFTYFRPNPVCRLVSRTEGVSHTGRELIWNAGSGNHIAGIIVTCTDIYGCKDSAKSRCDAVSRVACR